MSNRPVKTPDTAYMLTTTVNGYGDYSAVSSHEVKCAFFQSFDRRHDANKDLIQSDAYAYLDRDNAFIKSLGYELQGLYFKIAPFGVDQWYNVTSVEVAQRKLLTNEVNNVLVTLDVTVPPQGA